MTATQLAVFNRIDEQGRYLGSVFRNNYVAGQYHSESYSVLACEKAISDPEKPYKALEMLCLAQDYALEQGFVLDWIFKLPYVKGGRNE